MKARKVVFAMAVLFTTGLATSCSTSDLSEDEILINAEEQAIDRDEVENEDT